MIRKPPILFASLLSALALGGVAMAQVPPHLDISVATVQELPPIDREFVPGRGMALSLTVGALPACNAGTGFLAYGFLIDADSDPATGVSIPPFDSLGVDARVTAICDPASGLFVSPIGAVTVRPGPGSATIEIRAFLDRMPSLGFRWVAFAQDGTVFSRLPQAPEYVFWTTHEKGVF